MGNQAIKLDERSIGLILTGLYLLKEHIEQDKPLGQHAWNVFTECVYKPPKNMGLGNNILETIEELCEAINAASSITIESE
jgi:hypothetical protein